MEKRIEIAPQMGLKTLLADTFKANVEMLGLCARLGFERVDFFPESATCRLHPETQPFTAFVRKDIPP